MDKKTTVLGKVCLTPRGDYNAQTEYEALDVISWQGSSWLVTEDFSGITPGNDNPNTLLLAQKGEQGNPLTFDDLTEEQKQQLKGDTGEGFKVMGYYDDLSELEAAIDNPQPGDAYGIGTSEPYDIYIYDPISESWINNGHVQGPEGPEGKTAYEAYQEAGGTMSEQAFNESLTTIPEKVDLTSTQTISGLKNFTTPPTINGDQVVTAGSEQTISGKKIFTNPQMQLPSHYYHNIYREDNPVVYTHYYRNEDIGKLDSTCIFRVSTTEDRLPYKELSFDGKGNLRWDQKEIYHTGNLDVSKFISNQENATLVASYVTTSTSAEGIRIKLPVKNTSNVMVVFTVRIYTDYQPIDIQFSGYLYDSISQWFEPKAIMICGSTSIRTAMGYDEEGYGYVWFSLPTGNRYLGCAVLDVVSSLSYHNWNEGWEFIRTDETPDTALAKTIHPPLNRENDILPTETNTYAIGSPGNRYSEGYFHRALWVGEDIKSTENGETGVGIIHDGRIELSSQNFGGGLIDFHYKGKTGDYTSRIIEDAEGEINIIASKLKVNGQEIRVEPTTNSQNAGRTTADKERLSNAIVPTEVEVLTSLTDMPVGYYNLVRTYTNATPETISFATTPPEGFECVIFIKNNTEETITQPIPVRNDWQSEEDHMEIPVGKIGEIRIKYILGTYLIRK